MKPVKTNDGKIPQRLGFLEGKASIPDDFDDMFAEEFAALFGDLTRLQNLISDGEGQTCADKIVRP